jgi:heat-inducible transcriptional repressor
MVQFQNQRQKEIFEAVIRDYVRTGEPVGSKTLAERHGLGLSSASIRKVLSELETLGYLCQAHTSAGRTPTGQGLRAYVDQILNVDGLPAGTRASIDRALFSSEGDEGSIFSLLTRLLTELTNQMGLVMAPGHDRLRFRRIYFVRLAVRKVLAVLVTENGVIQNRLLAPAQDYTQDELNEVNVCLEDIAAPFTLDEIKSKLIVAMGVEKNRFEELYLRTVTLAGEAIKVAADSVGSDIFMDDEGRGRLLDHPDFQDVETMRSLFKAFENKRRLIELLNEVTDGGRVRVVFEPSGDRSDGLALVASPYDGGPNGAGALGVLGPRRLNYAEIVPVVDYAARVVSSLLAAKN